MSVTDKYMKLKQENEHLTRLLSTICKSIDAGGNSMSTKDANELAEWWEEHKKLDGGK